MTDYSRLMAEIGDVGKRRGRGNGGTANPAKIAALCASAQKEMKARLARRGATKMRLGDCCGTIHAIHIRPVLTVI